MTKALRAEGEKWRKVWREVSKRTGRQEKNEPSDEEGEYEGGEVHVGKAKRGRDDRGKMPMRRGKSVREATGECRGGLGG